MTKRGIKNSLTFVFILFLLLMGLYAYKKPLYNWDTLPYMGVVLSYGSEDVNFIHDTVYKIAEQQISPAIYNQLTDSSVRYKKIMAENANAFNNELPFYVVKPLYTGLAYLFYKAGFPLLKATIMPSVIAYIAMGVLLFLWLIKYLQFFFAFLSCLLTMICAPVLNILKGSSPDCLAAFLLLTALYFITEKKSLIIAFLFLLLSVFARLDNIIPCFLIVSMLAFTGKQEDKLAVKKYLAMLLAMAVCYLLITSGALKYGWGLLYYPSFSTHLNIAHETGTIFSFKDYFILFSANIVSGFFFSYLVLFMLLALIVFIDRSSVKFRDFDPEHLLLLVIIISIAVRFILQPIIADRFYIAWYIYIIILLIKKCTGSGMVKNNLQ